MLTLSIAAFPRGSPADCSKRIIFQHTFQLPRKNQSQPKPPKQAEKKTARVCFQSKQQQETDANETDQTAQRQPEYRSIQSHSPPRVRTATEPASRAQRASPPHPAEAPGESQGTRLMQALPRARHPRPDQVQDLRRKTPHISQKKDAIRRGQATTEGPAGLAGSGDTHRCGGGAV